MPNGIIGRMREQVSVQSASQAADGLGGVTNTWAAISGMPVYASIIPKEGKESAFGGRLEHRITHEIVIRYLSTVTAAMRVLFGSRVFHIHGFMNIEELDQFLVLRCQEGAPS